MTDEEREKQIDANIEKLSEDPRRAIYSIESCIGCKYYEPVGPVNPQDHSEHGICHHKEIQDKFNCKGREH